MVAAYARHSGVGHVTPRWAFSVPLMSDEIISSWLVRAALTQGCDPLVMTGEIWPNWRIWTQDADRFLVEDRIDPLIAASGITKDAFRTATLYPVACRILGGNPPQKARWPWILALGARNTKRRGGLQYCPSCLRTDINPYYRIQWRFVWHTGCERHRCSLLDRCWNCGAPLELHRLIAEDGHVAVCATCKADLRTVESDPYSFDAMVFQQEGDRVLHESRGTCLGRPVSTTEWFQLANFFASLVRRASRSRADALVSLATLVEAPLPEGLPRIAGVGVEQLRGQERQKILGAAWRFLATDRCRIEGALKKSGITRQGLCGRGNPSPALVAELAETLPNNPVTRTRRPKPHLTGPRPHHQVMHMMARLERRLKIKCNV